MSEDGRGRRAAGIVALVVSARRKVYEPTTTHIR